MESSGQQPNNKEDAAHHDEPMQIDENDAAILSLCEKILCSLAEMHIIYDSWKQLTIYILSEDELPTYDGVANFDGQGGRANRIGLRTKDQDGQAYKLAAVVGTFLHELAHALDGYRHTGKLAHSPSFYNHYSRILLAASKAALFELPSGMNPRNHKALQRFDDLSPFSDLLDSCLLFDGSGIDKSAAGTISPGSVRVTLRHQKHSSSDKVAVINTACFSNILKAFQQKFPRHSNKRRHVLNVTTPQGEEFRLSAENLDRVREGDTIYCRQS